MCEHFGMINRCLAAVLCSGLVFSAISAETIIPLQSQWKYFLGTTEASSPVSAWRFPNFNDSTWPVKNGPIGYGEAYVSQPELPSSSAGNYLSVFCRKTFVVNDPAAVGALDIVVQIDDGFVLWINGDRFVTNYNTSGFELGYNGTASSAIEMVQVAIHIDNAANVLIAGTNVIAVQVFNANSTSSDLVFDLSLTSTADTTPPTLTSIFPTPGVRVRTLDQVEVVFSEPVTGVNATDLLINNVPAQTLEVITPSQYVFNFTQPPTGVVQIAFAPNHGITDLAPLHNPFAGASWSNILDTNITFGTLYINEFLAANNNGIRDEDGDSSDWIELYNSGVVTINLGGYFLTDDPLQPTKFRLPPVPIYPNGYVLIWASGKFRTNNTANIHANFQLSRNAGGNLLLLDNNTNVISSFYGYPYQYTDVSYGRDRSDPGVVGYFSTPTPRAANATTGPGFSPPVIFSRTSGTFVTNFYLTLSTTNTNAVIRYVLGTNAPDANSTIYTGPILINNSVEVRARSYQPGMMPGEIHTEDFIKLDSSVLTFTSDIPVMIIHNYGGGTVPSTRGQNQFAMIQVYEPKNGITSLTNPPDTVARGVIRRRGSSTFGATKVNLRVEFHDEYNGVENLPLLGMPADNDWVLHGVNNFDPSYIHNPLAQLLYEQMGYYTVRTRIIECYLKDDAGTPAEINSGDYFGIYILMEKIKIAKDRVNIPELKPENTNSPAITGGYMMNYDRAGDAPRFNAGGWDLNFTDPDLNLPEFLPHKNYIIGWLNQFYAALSSASFTNPVTGYAPYIDVDNWIDYHIQNVLTFNVDGLRLSCYFYKDRLDPDNPKSGRLIMGPQWDYDRTQGSTDSRDFNPRVWRSTVGDKGTDFFNADTTGSTGYQNIWYRRLFTDPDFWQRYIDRYQEWRQSALSVSNINADIDMLTAQIRGAQPRDRSRWGLNPRSGTVSAGGYSYNFNGTYQGEVDWIKRWYAERLSFMDSEFVSRPAISRPSGPVTVGTTVTISAPAGTIYYTLDGTDPRAPGGNGPSATAQPYTGPITINANARLVARAFDVTHNNQTGPNNPPLSSHWSGPVSATYVVATPRLIITELMFNPPKPPAGNTNDADAFEFIELKNAGTTALNLRGFQFTNGIDFVFTNDVYLGPGQYGVLVKNIAQFQLRYPNVTNILGQYYGNLNNGGERITLVGPLLEPVLDFKFDDKWAELADGNGFSLVVVDENASASAWTNSSQWRISQYEYGSPGAPEPPPLTIAPVLINEALSASVFPQLDAIELYNPNPFPVDIGSWYLSDDFENPKKFMIPYGYTIPAHGYAVFTEADFNAFPGQATSFALSAKGDEVYLFSASTNGLLTGYYHGFRFDAAASGVSFGRYVNSVGGEYFVAQSANTFGGANAAPVVGPVVISEIMYHPPDFVQGTNVVDNTRDEFVELENITDQLVPLFDPDYPTNTWRIRGGIEYDFPQGVQLGAGARLLVVNFDPQTNIAARTAFLAYYNLNPDNVTLYGPYGKKLGNVDDTIKLSRPGTPSLPPAADAGYVPYIEVDRVDYQNGSPWPCGSDGSGNSLQRLQGAQFGNEPGNWVAALPTPGQPTVPQPPGLATFAAQPQGRIVAVGSTITLNGSVCGVPPFYYQWQFNDQDIPGATNTFLILRNLALSDSGNYTLVVSNSAGVVRSLPAQVIVQTPPAIAQHPQSRTILGFTDVSFSVTPSGTPPFSYQWRFNGQDLSGETNATLVLTNVLKGQQGTYSVLVYNTAGSVLSSNATLVVNVPAYILSQPQDVATSNRYPAILSANVTGDPPMTYQWYFNTNATYEGAVPVVNSTNVTGANSNVLTIASSTTSYEGYYYLTLSNAFGVVTSRLAALVVVTLRITQQPQSYIVAAGTPVEVFVGFSGTMPLGYRWRTNGSGSSWVLTDSGYARLYWPSVQLINAGTYQLVATNAANLTGVGSSNAYVTVIEPPASQTAYEGANLQLSAGIGSVAAYTNYFYWVDQQGNLLQYFTTNQARRFTNTLVLTNVQLTQSGTYTFMVSNGTVGAVSFPFSVDVRQRGAPFIFQQPAGQTNLIHSNATFAVYAAAGEPLINFRDTWRYRLGTNEVSAPTNAWRNLGYDDSTWSAGMGPLGYGLSLTNTGLPTTTNPKYSSVFLRRHFVVNDPAALSLLGISLLADDGVIVWLNGQEIYRYNVPAGELSCTNTALSTNFNLQQTVLLSNNLQSLLVAGDNVLAAQVFNVNSTNSTLLFDLQLVGGSNAPASYQWYFNRTNLLPGATQPALVFADLLPFQAGEYQVVVSNSQGFATSQVAALVVLVPPVIIAQPESKAVFLGSNAVLAVGVDTNSTRPLAYQWYFNDNLLAGATNDTLSLTNVQSGNFGNYYVVVSNIAGVVTSQVATISLIQPPVIVSEPQDVHAPAGANVTFSVSVSGSAPLYYQWFYNGDVRLAFQNGPTLVLENVSEGMSGTYHVLVINDAGSVTSRMATLTVETEAQPPTITAQPSSQTVPRGGTAVLSVGASGDPPLSCQWYFNMTNLIAGATNFTLVISNADLLNAGAYYAVISNPAGSVTSLVANLAVVVTDSDGDGIPDDWELAHGLNPNNPADRNQDADGDGMTNWQEYLAGTDPANPNDALKLQIQQLAPGWASWTLRFTAVSNHSYTVQRSGIISGPWQRLLDVPAVSTNRVIELSNPVQNGPVYLRVITPQQP